MSTPADDALERIDLARFTLIRKYRWFKRILRSLKPTPVTWARHTISIDPWLRLYVNPAYVATLTNDQLEGAILHECNHIARRHNDRLGSFENHRYANIAADCEINEDLREQGVVLPEKLFYPDGPKLAFPPNPYTGKVGQEPAEVYYRYLIDGYIEEPTPNSVGNSSGGSSTKGDGSDEQGETSEGDSASSGRNQGGESDGNSGSPSQPDEDDDSGEDDDESGFNEDDDEQEDDQDLFDPGCGTGSGNEDENEDPPPPDEEQARVARELRHQDEDIVAEYEADPPSGGGYSPHGIVDSLYKGAKERLGRSTHDWRKTLATDVRNAVEQSMDDAEEYTHRRPSRRQAAFGYGDDVPVLSRPYRPIPRLAVVADVSGSMDEDKLRAAMREVGGILERLAIPEFTGYAYSDHLHQTVRVSQPADIELLFGFRGGSTDMVRGITQAIGEGAEVVVCLTDAECSWADCPATVPLIIGGIKRKTNYVLPRHARVVDVEPSEQGEYADAF